MRTSYLLCPVFMLLLLGGWACSLETFELIPPFPTDLVEMITPVDPTMNPPLDGFVYGSLNTNFRPIPPNPPDSTTSPLTIQVTSGWEILPQAIYPDRTGRFAFLLRHQTQAVPLSADKPKAVVCYSAEQNKEQCYTLSFEYQSSTSPGNVALIRLRPQPGLSVTCQGLNNEVNILLSADKSVSLNDIRAFLSSSSPATVTGIKTTQSDPSRTMLTISLTCLQEATLLIGGRGIVPLLLSIP